VALRPGDRRIACPTTDTEGKLSRAMNARAVAAWSAACLFIVLSTTNPAYKAIVVTAALASLAVGAGLRRMRVLLFGVLLISAFATLLNFISAHLGATILFELPATIPAIGGPYTLEALAFGASGGITIAAAVLSAAPFSLVLVASRVMDALPAALSRTGTAVAASLNLVPAVATSFAQVTEAQRLRGWRPRGPRSWMEIVVPVVLTSVEGSVQLAESMEARGFGDGPRTAARSTSLIPSDWVLVAASGLALAAFAVSRAAGWAADWFAYPTLTLPAIDPRPTVACLLLFAPVLVWRSRR
jgi:energy-coupling factor transport system permease protein